MTKPRSQTERDHIDRFLEEFKEEFPAEVDLEVEGIVDRIGGINRRLLRALDETLAEYGLSNAAYKVLSTLRWAGAPYRRSAGELAKMSDLSSGAMTSRLDQLEKAGLVRRLRDPEDRRGVLVEPTDEGQEALGADDRRPGAEGGARRRGAERARAPGAEHAPATRDARVRGARGERKAD